MAVQTVESPLDFSDFTTHSTDSVSDGSPDDTPEINLGAFRGLAFALIFETVLVILGSLAWQVFRTFVH
jgi:hypothetical protein